MTPQIKHALQANRFRHGADAELDCSVTRTHTLGHFWTSRLIERWLPRPAEAGECPEGVQRGRWMGVSMGENAPSGREKIGEDDGEISFCLSGTKVFRGSALGISVFEFSVFEVFSFSFLDFWVFRLF